MALIPLPEELEAHPIALLFPPLSPEQGRELANDIRSKGLINDIWLYEDAVNGGEKKPYILDGRSRFEACVTEKIEPRYKFYEGDDPLGFAVSLNERRRHHMSLADRKALAKRLADYNPAITDRELAKSAGLGSHTTAGKVRRGIMLPPPNGQNDHKDEADNSSDETDTSAPVPRVEGSGRKARGRKPSVAPKLAPTKTKPRTANRRDLWVTEFGVIFGQDPAGTVHAVVMLIHDVEAKIQEKISEHTRRDLATRFCNALGMVIKDQELPAAAVGVASDP